VVAWLVGMGVTTRMIAAQRPATRHQGGARRPTATYYRFKCAACGRQAADVAPCSTCGWTCCTGDATCHRAHLPRTFAAAVARSEACRLEGTSAYRCWSSSKGFVFGEILIWMPLFN
jgi:hypothetical protein